MTDSFSLKAPSAQIFTNFKGRARAKKTQFFGQNFPILKNESMRTIQLKFTIEVFVDLPTYELEFLDFFSNFVFFS